MTSLQIDVVGTPAPQGSKKGFIHPRTGRVVVVDDNKKPLRSWRSDVQTAAAAAIVDQATGEITDPVTGPLKVTIVFWIGRPGYHFGTGRNAGVLKPTAPAYVAMRPDVDKLVRSTLDGLKEAGMYRDDQQVADLRAVKRYADGATGARITIAPLDSVPANTPGPGTDHTSSGVASTPAPEEALF